MLPLTLLVLLSAGALLGVALATGETVWAWGSAGTSALAAVMLLGRAWRVRRRSRGGGRHRPGAARRERAAAAAADTAEKTHAETGASAHSPAPTPDGANSVEEDTDAADLVIVSELDDEVLVVDEYPRYHLDSCTELDRGAAEVVPVREARELGFTPCARCRPDAELAARHRTTSAT